MPIALDSVFQEFAALLVLASAVGLVGLLLRQPLIVSFIIVGVLAGPAGLDIVRSTDFITLLAELGVAVLLFLVGLKLDLHLIRSLGPVAAITGLGQVAFTSVLGLGLCLLLGMDALTALYVAVALTFSSTIIVVKLLSDKHEIDSLHGRIALGFLIVQDLVVVVAMVAVSAFGIGRTAGEPLTALLRLLSSGLLLLIAIAAFMRYLGPRLLKRLARSPELLVSFAIAWAALLAALGDELGYGKELGGLAAGVALASTPYREAIAARLTSLRDFLLLFFFVGLGADLRLDALGQSLIAAAALSLFVLIGNPLIVLALMGYLGYRKRTGFLAGLTVAQISEFSLIFMAMGLGLGHVSEAAVTLVTVVGLITITLSTYLIVYSQMLYRWLEPLLRPFERRRPHRELHLDDGAPRSGYDVILFGLGRYGRGLCQRLTDSGLRVLGVDFDPEAVRRWRQAGHDAIYGDALDPDFPLTLPLSGTRWVISSFPTHSGGLTEPDPRLTLLHALRSQGYGGSIAVTALHHGELASLLERGATLVLLPAEDAADQAADLLLGRQTRDSPSEPAEARAPPSALS